MAGRIRSRVVRDVGLWRSRAALRRHPGFDAAWYSVLNGATLARDDAVRDYLRAGRGQGWSPHPLFDPGYYVARGGPHRMLLEAFAGYVSVPARRRLTTHALLDVDAYLAATPQALSYPGGPIEHYLSLGDPGLRERLVEHGGTWARRRHLAGATRLTSRFDARAAERFVAAYAGVLPDAGDAPVTVSVILPVWNRAAQVGQAIDSVRAQTLSDWELFVVDDGSTDDLGPVLDRYADDPRVRLLRRPHEGVGAARNAGLAVASGRYVAWLDSDDTWTPEHLRVTVAFMQREGHRAAYDVLELRRPGHRPGFRTLAGGRELLVNGNHIGQTVLVHERSLVAEVGGYDEQLPRTVDFDFILRMSAVTDFGFAPFVGCVVNHDPADFSRITRSHPATWIDVVLNRDTLDWASAAAAVREPSGGTVVVVAPADHEAITASIERLAASTEGSAAQILVVDNGLDLMPSQVLASVAWRNPRVRVVAAPSDRGWAVAVNLGVLAATTERVVLVDPLVEPSEGWLGPLLSALDAAGVLGAQSAGVDPASGSGRIDALSWGACALRVSDLVPLFGLDPLIRPQLAMSDLSRRLAASGGGWYEVASASTVTLPADGLHPLSRHPELDQAAADLEGGALFAARWG
jgi:O-antigen biosynthesis protein